MLKKRLISIVQIAVLALTTGYVSADTKPNTIWLEGQGIAIQVDSRTSIAPFLVDKAGKKTALTKPIDTSYTSAALLAGKSLINDFTLTGSKFENNVEGVLGRGKRLVVTGRSKSKAIVRTIVLEVSDNLPGVVFLTTKYKSENNDLTVNRFIENRFTVEPLNPPAAGPRLWSFQGSAFEWGQDYIFPIRKREMHENRFAMFGGVPYVDVYSHGGGIGIGSASQVQLDGISIPVNEDSGTAKMNFQWPGKTLAKGVDTVIGTSFIVAHTGDFYTGCKKYSEAMAKRGVAPPSKFEAAAYYQQWETYGYENDFTIENITSKLDDLKAMGIDVVTLDSGWFNWDHGDWTLDKRKFPGGDSDLKALTDKIHSKGLKAQIWWMPGIVSQDSNAYKQHPEWVALDKDQKEMLIKLPLDDVSTDRVLCPSLNEVQDFFRQFTKKAIQSWGIDGFKLDSIYSINGPCYSAGHKHKSPDDAVADYPLIFKAIYDEALKLKPDFIINICNCGVAQNFYLYPYQNRLITSDITDGRQLRGRVKALKALFGSKAPVLDDHVELTQNFDFASQLGTGGILETKFTDLDANDKKFYSKWLRLGKDLGLSSGSYRGDLYLYGFDFPEAHVIQKGKNLFYGFYADRYDSDIKNEVYKGTIEIRGLDAGKTYDVVDYINGKTYGTVMGPVGKLNVSFKNYLLLRASQK